MLFSFTKFYQQVASTSWLKRFPIEHKDHFYSLLLNQVCMNVSLPRIMSVAKYSQIFFVC